MSAVPFPTPLAAIQWEPSGAWGVVGAVFSGSGRAYPRLTQTEQSHLD